MSFVIDQFVLIKFKEMIRRLLIFLVLAGFSKSSFADYPIVSHRFLADPGSLVYNGRVYLYCSNDDENPGTEAGGYQMKSIVCVSSDDMKNWTDRGIVFQVPRDATWAGNSWAPSVAERDGTFYLYFGNGGSGIGVATANNPLGPFTDAIGGTLVNGGTPGVMPAENIWVFDPMTFIDDDGQAYMYFGGNGEDNLRVVRLNDDMISLEGPATQFHVPYFFEAAWMHKHNGKYYFTYSTNPSNGMRIDYMTSNNPVTDFTYGGVVSPQPPENNNNNHQAVFEFNGTWYQAYHNRFVARQLGILPTYKRNLCLDTIFHNPDGSIVTMVNSLDGVRQIGNVNPYERVEAETMNSQSGIKTEVCTEGGMNVTDIDNDDWIRIRGVDFGSTGPGAFTASVASDLKYGETKGGFIEIRLDELNGTILGTVPVTYTGGPNIWKTETITLEEATGVHDVYFVFKGGDVEDVFKFDYWFFTEKTGAHDLFAINAFVEDYKIDIVDGSDSTKISVIAIYTDGISEDITTEAVFTFNPQDIVLITDSLVKGIAYGAVTISAEYNGSMDSVRLIVKDLESELTVSRIYADTEDLEISAGSSVSVKIYAEYEDEHVEEVTEDATYENPNPEIAVIVNGKITAMSEGEVDILVSYQGDLGESKTTTLHITVVNGSGVWLEAECGEVGSLWNIVTQAAASHSEYVTVQPGNNSTDGPPADASGWLTYNFNLTASGNYTLYFRVICPNANDDSYWLKMDDGSFVTWNNITGSSSWIWASFPSTYNLDAGNHTLTIGYREDGAHLDKIYITNEQVEIPDQGGEAVNCLPDLLPENDDSDASMVYPNPASDELILTLENLPADVSIFKSDGRMAFQNYFQSGPVIINISGYTSGIYFVKVSSGAQIKAYPVSIR